MGTVEQDVAKIRNAIYGKDVREAIADGIENCYANTTIEGQIDIIEQAGEETIAHVQQAIADSRTAVNQLDDQKDTIAEAVASMASLGTDTTLSTSGMAADAKATGDVVNDLKSVIDSHDSKINVLHDLVNYGYDTPYDLASNPSGVATRIGIKRYLNTIVLNGTADIPSGTKTIKIRLDNEVARTRDTSEVKAWTNGIMLEAGQHYVLTSMKLSGSIKNENATEMPSVTISVYKQGENETVAPIIETGDNYYKYGFTAEENTQYHVVVYIQDGRVLTDAKVLVTMEKISDEELLFSSNYTQLEYAESNRSQYTSTGVKLNQDSRVKIRASFTNIPDAGTVEYLFGGRKNSTIDAFGIGIVSSGRLYVGYGAYGYVDFYPSTDVHEYDFNGKNLYVDGALVNTFDETTFTTASNAFIFATSGASNTAYYGNCRIYSCKIYDENGNLIRDFVPVIQKSDSAIRMYDRVTKQVYATNGTDLVASPVMSVENNLKSITDNTTRIHEIETRLDEQAGHDYVVAEADRVAKKVHNVQTGQTLTFIACSDLHYAVAVGSSDGVTVKESQEALRDMTDGILAVAEQTHIDFYACFGDVIYQWQSHGANYENGVTEMFSVTKLLSEAFGNNPQIRMVGNHDPNCENGQDKEFSAYMMNSFAGIYSEMLTKDEAFPYGGYGYHDFERQKVRFIVLNTSFYTPETNLTNAATVYNIGADQAYWLCTALDMSDKSDADKWQIVIGSHIAMDSDNANICRYTGVLNAYVNGSTWSYLSRSYDFGGKNAAKLALYLNGHTHAYRFKNLKYVNASNVLQAILPMANLYIPNALPGREGASTDGETYSKTANSAESTSFQVITVDFVNGIVYAHHYGAGIDIVMHYDPSTEASLSTDLTEPTWASVDDTIATVSSGMVTPVTNGYVMIYAKSETDNCIEVWNYQSVI